VSPTTRHRALGILVLIALLACVPVDADTYEVDRTDDSIFTNCNPLVFPDCSLRGAIIKANNHAGDDTIRLGAHTYVLSIAGHGENGCQTGDLDVLGTLTIEGKGPERTVIDAAGVDRVLQMHATGGVLTVRGVTITGGLVDEDAGAGVYATHGSLVLENCVVSGNEIEDGGQGVAVCSVSGAAGDYTMILDSWITGNTAGPGVESILLVESALIDRTTVSGNTTPSNATIVEMWGSSSDLQRSTIEATGTYHGIPVRILGYSALVNGCTLISDGWALVAEGPSPSVVRNTLIVGACMAGAWATSDGGNLESPGNTCGLGASDLVNVADPGLSALGFFGGPAPVHRPLPGSLALDQPLAVPGCTASDQRRLSRPRDGNGDGAAVCDIGAVELAGPGEVFVETFDCGFTTAWSVVVH